MRGCVGRVLGDVGCVECGAWPSPRSTLYIHTPTHQPPHSTLHRPHSTLQTPLYSAHMGSCFGVFAVRTQKKALSSTLLCDIVQQMENCFFSRMQSTMFRTQFLHVSARQHNICCILYAPKGTSSHGVSWGCGICSRVTFSIGNIFHR